MRVKRRRSSSSFSEDDKPLITMQIRHDDHNSYDSLCRHNKQMCEFCDKVFENRYRRIIHNMKHIIIPLLNLTVYQCKECLHHFISQDDLLNHTGKKHPKTKLLKTHLVKEDKSLIKTESQPIIIDLTLPNLNESDQKAPSKSDLVPKSQGNSIEGGSIKSRLFFEDDLVLNCDRLLNTFTVNCQVNLESYQLNSATNVVNTSVEPYGLDVDEFSHSVHYDELVKPGVYTCRKCVKRFPVRYDAIIHEASHIKFKNARVTLCGACNEYILGNGEVLMLHYLTKHKERPSKITRNKAENNSQMHENNNLKALCSNTEENSKKPFLNEDEEKTSYSKTIMLCDLCFLFCKSGNSRSYVCIGSLNKLGKRYPCKKCGSLFFEVKLVKQQINLRRHVEVKKGGKKKTSNEERLKSIKNRFKLLKN